MEKQTLSARTNEMDREIGARIKAVRKAARMSQTALSDQLGITFQQFQKYEKGMNRMAVSTLVLTCQALSIQPMDILGSYFDNSAPSTALDLINGKLVDAADRLKQIHELSSGR